MRVFLWLLLFVSPIYAADFEVLGNQIVLSGEIVAHDDESFVELIGDHQDVDELRLESRGGDVYTAMQIGNLARRHKLNTVASGECLSACTLIFISGLERRLEGGGLGFHRVLNAKTGAPVQVEDPLYNRLTLFAWGKGVDPFRFVQWMTFAYSDAIYYPEESELCGARILRPCER